MPSMNESDHRLLQTLDQRVKFLMQRLGQTPSQGSTHSTTALEIAVAALEASMTILNTMIEPGVASGFFAWGPSAKGNAWSSQESGYDRGGDRVFAGGQVFIETEDDAPTLLGQRKETLVSTTCGWSDNTNIFRIDAAPWNKNGTPMYANGADNAALAIGMNLHIPFNGSAPADAYSFMRLQVINELESNTTKPPRTGLEITGANGGEIWARQYNSTGGETTVSRRLFP